MKYDCRFVIRESGIERERETVYIRRIYPPIHDMIRDYEKLEKSKIRHWFAVFGGSQSRNVASIFEILGNFHIVESHEADSIQFLFGLSPSEYWMLYIFEIPSFFFLRREGSNSFRSYCPASPGSRDTFGKVDHLESILTTFKFYNTFREYTSRYTSSHLFQKFSLEKIYILDRIKMQRILKF